MLGYEDIIEIVQEAFAEVIALSACTVFVALSSLLMR